MGGRVNCKDVMFRMNGMPRAQEAQEWLVSVLHGV